MDKGRLTYALQHFDETGPLRAPYQICKGFVTQGWDVDLVALGNGPNEGVAWVWDVVPLRRKTAVHRKLAILKLTTSLARPRKHLVLSEVWPWHAYGLLLAKQVWGSPYALALDSYTHLSGVTPWQRLRERLRYELLLRHANLILAESPEAFLAAKRTTRRAKVVHVPVCLWQQELTAIEEAWAAQQFNPRREKVVLFAGRLLPRKRVDDLITAFTRLRATFPDWTLEIRGIPTSATYQQQLVQLGQPLGKQVAFQPPLGGAALYRRYRETAVFALPSEGEGMPTTILEAMYFGGAIVAGISGAVAYQLGNGRAGLLHQPGDLDTLTSHLHTLMASAETREAYMAQARQRMTHLFVWERYFPQLAHIFAEALRP